EGEAFDRVHANSRPDELEQPRDDVDLDVEILELADEMERLLVRLVRERDDHALDVEQPDDRGQAIRIAQQCEMLEVAAPLLGIRVDETDEIDAVLRMLE